MAVNWFADLELDESGFLNQCHGDCLDQFMEQHMAFPLTQNQNQIQNENQYKKQQLHRSISSGSNTGTAHFNPYTTANVTERPTKIAKTTSWESSVTGQSSFSPTILSFGAPAFTTKVHAGYYGGASGDVKQPKEEVEMPGSLGNFGCNKRSYDAMLGGEAMKKVGNGNHTGSSYEHILAERKRREKLSQRFIALSKIVPGLKKTDKASVLGDAIKYLKQLQDRVDDLEEQSTKRTIESAIIVNRSQLAPDEEYDTDNISSCDENFNQGGTSKGFPEIEAKMSDRTVLIRIHCENHKGALVKVLAEIEALSLSITSTNVVPFAGSSIDITIMAEVDEEFSMGVKDVVKKLNNALKPFM